jgi:hypothetical protein
MPAILEKLFAPLAVRGLIRVVAGFQGMVFLLLWLQGSPERALAFMGKLTLDFERVLAGEFWRLISFVALPPVFPFEQLAFLWIIFSVFFLFLISDILEAHWGAAGTTAFFWLGVAAAIAASVLLWTVLGPFQAAVAHVPSLMLGSSLLIAAGILEPRHEIRLMLLFPVPLGLVAVITGLYLIWLPLRSGSLVLFGFILLSQAHLLGWAVPRWVRHGRAAALTRSRRRRFDASRAPDAESFHRCEQCGATELSHPEREFRITAQGRELCGACRGDSGSLNPP